MSIPYPRYKASTEALRSEFGRLDFGVEENVQPRPQNVDFGRMTVMLV